MKKVRIGGGAGYAGDRLEPALELLEHGDIQYLVFETLAERTIARENLERLKDPAKGYNPWLDHRIRKSLPIAKSKGIKIITNMGAANPESAAEVILGIAKELGLEHLKVAVITGDNITAQLQHVDTDILETGQPLSVIRDKMESANVYLGADLVVEALKTGADVIVTGRMADPSLFLGPMMYELGWDYDDYAKIGQGSVVAHLMECAGQVTGGYFADPGYKEVPRLWELGFPICEVYEDGTSYITKVPGTGGAVTLATCKEQMLYEIHDPAMYITPDCVVDFTGVEFIEAEPDKVQVIGGRGKPRTTTYKVSVGYRNGFIGEGQISYGGPGALPRVRLAGEIVQKRLELRGIPIKDLRIDYIGVQSLHEGASTLTNQEPYEVRLRVAGITETREAAHHIGAEVETLLTNGPYGGAGDFKQVREIIAVLSVLVPRELVQAGVIEKEMVHV